jgi:hypothetical protein
VGFNQAPVSIGKFFQIKPTFQLVLPGGRGQRPGNDAHALRELPGLQARSLEYFARVGRQQIVDYPVVHITAKSID